MSDLFTHGPSRMYGPGSVRAGEERSRSGPSGIRRRLPVFLAALLARFRPPAAGHDAPPQAAPVPPPRSPEPDGRDPAETMLDVHWWVEERVRPYIPQQRGGRHHGG